MTEPAQFAATPQRWAIAMLAMLGGIAVMLLSSQQMSDLRGALPLLSHAMNWLEMLPLPLDMDHVVFFALVAGALRLLLKAVPIRWLLVGLGAMAVGTELLQFMTVGRTPNVLDARDDMIGATIGLLLGSVPLWWAKRSGALLQLQLGDGALLAGIVLLPIQQWSPLAAFGFPLVPSDLMFAIAIAVRGFAWAGGRAPLQWSGFHSWLAAYALAMLLAVLVLSPVRADSGLQGLVCPTPSPTFAGAMAKWLGVLWLVLIATAVGDSACRAGLPRRLLMAWLLGTCIAAVVAWLAVVGFYLGDGVRTWIQPLLSHYGSLPPGPYPRVVATFANANMFGLYLLLSVGAALAAHDAGWLRSVRLRYVLAALSLPIVATASPAIGATALLLGLWWQSQPGGSARARRGWLLVAAVIGLLNLVVLAVNPAAPLSAPSVRLQLWGQAWSTWATNPWRGAGLDQPAAGVTYNAPDGAAQYLTDAHNIVLNLGAQGGLIAVLAFFGLMAWVLLRSRSIVPARGLWLAFLLAVGYLGIGGSFEDARVLWVSMGLLAGVAMTCARSSVPPACTDMHAPARDQITDAQRSAIASWIVGHAGLSPAALVEAYGVEAVLAAIEREGVLSLVHARFAETRCPLEIPDALRTTVATRARASAARSLLCLAEARRIQHALDGAGIEALWMKGIALGHWLYPQPHLRDIADMDLLLPDHATTLRAAAVLAPLGYALPNPHIAGDLVVHELLAWSERAQLELDLHWELSNHALFAGRLRWDALASAAMPLPGLGEGARGLSPVHALLHACMHRALNMLTGREDRLRWLYDIHLLASRFDAEAWTQAVRVATDARLADACASALQACGEVLHTAVPGDALLAYNAAAALEPVRTVRLCSWSYMQRASWQALPDLRTRLRWLRQLLIPRMNHMQVRYGADGRGAWTVIARRLDDGWRRWRGYTARSHT